MGSLKASFHFKKPSLVLGKSKLAIGEKVTWFWEKASLQSQKASLLFEVQAYLRIKLPIL